MITLTDYITYGEVRAVLGVSIYELSDETLALPLYARGLQTKLREISGTVGSNTGNLVEIFDAIELEVSPTADEEDFVDLIKQLAVYIVAEACLSGLSLMALKTESDGKATQSRFSDASTYLEVGKNIRATLAGTLDKITDTLGVSTVTLPLISAGQPDIDRVTGA